MKSMDLSDCAAPEDVVRVLREAAQSFGESQGELDAAWQRTNGNVWEWMGRRFEAFANQIEREIPKHL